MPSIVYKAHITQDKDGRWSWRLRSPNGRTVACSGETFSRKDAAEAAIARLSDAILTVVKEPTK